MAKRKAKPQRGSIEFVATSDRDGAIAALCQMLPASTKLTRLIDVLGAHGYRVSVSMQPRELGRRRPAKERK